MKKLTKESKQSVIVMLILMIIMLFGIFWRWDYISKELKFGIDRYTRVSDTISSVEEK
ncbi:MAG: hypothetical protein IMY73_02940 [Bacteroidetes bacterium]|nr:hypothetical protein [Bacteroidota bacterium]